MLRMENEEWVNKKTLTTIASGNSYGNQFALFGDTSALYTIHFSPNKFYCGFDTMLGTGFALKSLNSKLRATN